MKYIIILAISFFMEGIVSVWLPFLNPLLTLIALIYISLFSKMSTSKLIKISAIVGFLYDVIYMHILLVNMLGFIIITYCLKKIDIQNNWKETLVISIITIVFYMIYLYIFVIYSNHVIFNWYTLLKSIALAILNLGYLLLLLIIFNRSKQRKISVYYYR